MTAPPLIAGVSYVVKGREADQWFVRGTRITFAGESTFWIDKGEQQTELSFVTEEGKSVILRRASLDGLEAVVPAEPSAARQEFSQAWKSLFRGDFEARARAFAHLAGHTEPLWQRALAVRALADRKAGLNLFERWAVANPDAAQALEPLLSCGELEAQPPLRLLFAKAHNPYFLGVLAQELSSSDPQTLRKALDEVALFPAGTLLGSVENLAGHENPSVALKAQRVLAPR